MKRGGLFHFLRIHGKKASNDNKTLTLGLKVRLNPIHYAKADKSLKFIAAYLKAKPMKTLVYLLSLTLLFSLSIDLQAQLTSGIAPTFTTGDVTDYAYDATTEASAKRELSKRERQRFQRSLVRRGDDLADWDLESEHLDMALNGRGARGRRAISRTLTTATQLTKEAPHAWTARLIAKYNRLWAP